MCPSSDIDGFMPTYSDMTGVFSSSTLKEVLMASQMYYRKSVSLAKIALKIIDHTAD